MKKYALVSSLPFGHICQQKNRKNFIIFVISLFSKTTTSETKVAVLLIETYRKQKRWSPWLNPWWHFLFSFIC